jgi:hypothetical protein
MRFTAGRGKKKTTKKVLVDGAEVTSKTHTNTNPGYEP